MGEREIKNQYKETKNLQHYICFHFRRNVLLFYALDIVYSFILWQFFVYIFIQMDKKSVLHMIWYW